MSNEEKTDKTKNNNAKEENHNDLVRRKNIAFSSFIGLLPSVIVFFLILFFAPIEAFAYAALAFIGITPFTATALAVTSAIATFSIISTIIAIIVSATLIYKSYKLSNNPTIQQTEKEKWNKWAVTKSKGFLITMTCTLSIISFLTFITSALSPVSVLLTNIGLGVSSNAILLVIGTTGLFISTIINIKTKYSKFFWSNITSLLATSIIYLSTLYIAPFQAFVYAALGFIGITPLTINALLISPAVITFALVSTINFITAFAIAVYKCKSNYFDSNNILPDEYKSKIERNKWLMEHWKGFLIVCTCTLAIIALLVFTPSVLYAITGIFTKIGLKVSSNAILGLVASVGIFLSTVIGNKTQHSQFFWTNMTGLLTASISSILILKTEAFKIFAHSALSSIGITTATTITLAISSAIVVFTIIASVSGLIWCTEKIYNCNPSRFDTKKISQEEKGKNKSDNVTVTNQQIKNKWKAFGITFASTLAIVTIIALIPPAIPAIAGLLTTIGIVMSAKTILVTLAIIGLSSSAIFIPKKQYEIDSAIYKTMYEPLKYLFAGVDGEDIEQSSEQRAKLLLLDGTSSTPPPTQSVLT